MLLFFSSEKHRFHPNIYNNGQICLDILQNQWSPIYDICAILTSIQSLLCDPNPASPANSEVSLPRLLSFFAYDVNGKDVCCFEFRGDGCVFGRQTFVHCHRFESLKAKERRCSFLHNFRRTHGVVCSLLFVLQYSPSCITCAACRALYHPLSLAGISNPVLSYTDLVRPTGIPTLPGEQEGIQSPRAGSSRTKLGR